MIVTYCLIGLTVLISMYAFSKPSLTTDLILNPYYVHTKNQYYRFLTSGFIHKDHIHLLWNMISLYFFGSFIERLFEAYFGSMGIVYYVLLYLLAIIASDIPTYLKQRKNPRYNSLGASGGVAAIIFAFILFRPLDLICVYIALCLPGFILGTAYVVFSWYQGKKANDNINHDAHLYGALFGIIFCFLIYPNVLTEFIIQIKSWEFLQWIN